MQKNKSRSRHKKQCVTDTFILGSGGNRCSPYVDLHLITLNLNKAYLCTDDLVSDRLIIIQAHPDLWNHRNEWNFHFTNSGHYNLPLWHISLNDSVARRSRTVLDFTAFLWTCPYSAFCGQSGEWRRETCTRMVSFILFHLHTPDYHKWIVLAVVIIVQNSDKEQIKRGSHTVQSLLIHKKT